MLKTYLTVKGYGEHELEIERSRFIAHVNRAETEEEALDFIAQIRKKHWDATHNCSAYLIEFHNPFNQQLPLFYHSTESERGGQSMRRKKNPPCGGCGA